jgi:hypothetical protein
MIGLSLNRLLKPIGDHSWSRMVRQSKPSAPTAQLNVIMRSMLKVSMRVRSKESWLDAPSNVRRSTITDLCFLNKNP